MARAAARVKSLVIYFISNPKVHMLTLIENLLWRQLIYTNDLGCLNLMTRFAMQIDYKI